MKQLFADFIFGFCKVECLCWHGDPNWLGWIFLVFGSVIAISVISGVFGAFAALFFGKEWVGFAVGGVLAAAALAIAVAYI